MEQPNIRVYGRAQPGAPRLTYVWIHRYSTRTERTHWDYWGPAAPSDPLAAPPPRISNRHWDVIMKWSYKARSTAELLEIQASGDGQKWHKVGTVGAMNTKASFLAHDSDNCARLTSTDANGQSACSQVLWFRGTIPSPQ